ncbi:unnamed protein product [Calypogeia fissa]
MGDKASSQGKNFNSAELKLLCYSYLEISQDPLVGAGQRKQDFWIRTYEHYDKNKGANWTPRSQKSLESKWSEVRKATTRFIGCHKTIKDLNPSGLSTKDIFNKAKELYKERDLKKKDFPFHVCYFILKDMSHWLDPTDQMAKGKKGQERPNGIRTTSNGTEVLENVPHPPSNDSKIHSETEGLHKDNGSSLNLSLKRPIGSKQAKENVKKARHLEDVLRTSAQA